LLADPGGVSRKRIDAAFAMPFDSIGAFRLSLLLSNFVRPRLQAIWATPEGSFALFFFSPLPAMSHRLLSSLVIALALAASPSTANRVLAQTVESEARNAAPPNVVMILSDDQAWTDYGFMGHEAIETPNLDRFARESLTFTRGYVPYSLCRPSLASIVTGLYPHQHGNVGNDPPRSGSNNGNPTGQTPPPDYLQVREEYLKLHIDKLQTLPELLRAKGYVSFQSGKWWEGSCERGGFDEGMTHGDPLRDGRHGDEGLQIGRATMQPVLDFLDRAAEKPGASRKPFFLWYAPMLPHQPHDPGRQLLAKYEGKAPTPKIAKYWAMCEKFDRSVGKLLEALDERGLAENTLVVYVTDNGWIQDPNADRVAPRSKKSPYDGGLRTPIMLRWPGRIEPRMDEQRLASSIDLVPTILHAAGLEPTAEMQGIDLLDDSAVENRHQIFGDIFEHDIVAMDDPAASLRWRWTIEENWKLIVPDETRLPGEPVELYDLAADPFEKKNLAADQPERVAELRKKLDAWWTPPASDAPVED
jgi:uncharacterized sulfatase